MIKDKRLPHNGAIEAYTSPRYFPKKSVDQVISPKKNADYLKT
jgi:hypothetical protein